MRRDGAVAGTVVLIVDDVAALAQQYAYDLRRLGDVEPLTAGDGAAALEILAAEPVDCVILDLELPGIDGLEVLRTMERRGIKPADAAGDDRAMAVAVRRCALCSGVEACEHWLAGGQSDPAAFCPNHTYLENLERAKRRATAKR